MKKTRKFFILVVILVVSVALAVYFVPWLAYKKLAKEKANSLPKVQLLDTSNWLTYKDAGFKFKIKYPSDWKYYMDPVFNCPIFYNEKYSNTYTSDRIASVSLCESYKFFLPKEAHDYMKRLVSGGNFEEVVLGYENYGLLGESPGGSTVSFVENRQVYNLTMMPLTWIENKERKYLSNEEDAYLRNIFRTMVGTIEPR